MKLLLPIITICLLSLSSCSKDIDCNAFNTGTQDEFVELSTAFDAYNADQTDDNCKKAKEAAENYLDAVRDFEGCTELDPNDYQAALEAAMSNLDQIPC